MIVLLRNQLILEKLVYFSKNSLFGSIVIMSRRLILLYFICDFTSVVTAFLLAYWLRFGVDWLPVRPVQDVFIYIRLGLFYGIISLLCLQVNRMYAIRFRRFSIDLVFGLVKSLVLSGILVILISFLFREIIILNGQDAVSRIIVGLSFVLSLLIMVFWRLVLFYLLRLIRKRGWSQIRILLVGPGSEVDSVGYEVSHNTLDYVVIGYCGTTGVTKIPRLGSLDDVKKVIELNRVQEVIIVNGDLSPEETLHTMRNCEQTGVRLSMVPDPSTLLLLPADLHEISSVPLMFPRRGLTYGAGLWIKRMLDVFFAILFLFITLPISLFTMAVIRLDTPGPVIYRQKRVGLYGGHFWIYKFRSMRVDADKLPAPPGPLDRETGQQCDWKSDTRVTRVGRWLRRLSIDEFPQFVNVIKGDMSIVGPRPHIPAEVDRYTEWHRRRFDAKPGITGLTQVSGRKNLDIDGMVRLDIYYIENWSVGLDIKIMLQTIPALFTGRGAY